MPPFADEPLRSTQGEIMLHSADVSREIVRLKGEGHSTEEIATQLDLSVASVKRKFRIALNAYLQPDVQELRAHEATKLDTMEESLQEKLEAGNQTAIVTALRIMDRRAKLLGLDVRADADAEKDKGPKVLDVAVYQSSPSEGFKPISPGAISAPAEGVDE